MSNRRALAQLDCFEGAYIKVRPLSNLESSLRTQPLHISIAIDGTVSDSDCKRAFQLLHELRSIDELVVWVTTDAVPETVRGNESVKTLSVIVKNRNADVADLIRSCPKCSSLLLFLLAEGSFDDDLWNSIIGLKLLREFRLDYGRSSISYEQLCMLEKLPVEHLQFRNVKLDQRWPEAISSCKELKSLSVEADLEACHSPIDLSPLLHLRSLNSLKLYGWTSDGKLEKQLKSTGDGASNKVQVFRKGLTISENESNKDGVRAYGYNTQTTQKHTKKTE